MKNRIAYILKNPNTPRCQEAIITIEDNRIWLQWSGIIYNNMSVGENGGFLSMRAAKMYITKERLSIGKSLWVEKEWDEIFPSEFSSTN